MTPRLFDPVKVTGTESEDDLELKVMFDGKNTGTTVDEESTAVKDKDIAELGKKLIETNRADCLN